MAQIQLKSEAELIQHILKSDHYRSVRERFFEHKIRREEEAWKQLQTHRGHFTADVLRIIFDKVDIDPTNRRWFGLMLSTPNQNLILQSSPALLNEWLEELLFSEQPPEKRLERCLRENKIKGASRGLATLLLYLSAPERFNIWVNATEEGLVALGRIDSLPGKHWGADYRIFNDAAIAFRENNGLAVREIDWFLSFIRNNVEPDENCFRIEEDALGAPDTPDPVADDADEIDDIVGEPAELGVMRWAPVNEMGVVALFVGHREALGFPVIELIRTGFPDAVAFQKTGKGQHVRRYIEFEFRSSGYKAHVKSKRKCHYVVCWEHNWKDCPIDVIELKTRIPELLKSKAGSENGA